MSWRWLILGLTLTGVCAACSKPMNRKQCYAAKGRVLVHGKPAAGALVVFYPADKSDPQAKSASGTTDEDGAFAMSTYETDDGVPEGDYDVAITLAKDVGKVSRDPLAKSTAKGRGREAGTKDAKKTLRTSGIHVKIEARENNLKPFELSP